MIKIDKGIEITEKFFRKGKAPIYPFRFMQVGDSFFVPLEGRKIRKLTSSIMGSARSKRMAGVKFSVRSVIENDVKGIRCWRIK